MPRGLTHQEAADRLAVTTGRIYQLLDAGKLTRGAEGLLTEKSVEDYAKNRRQPGRPRHTK